MALHGGTTLPLTVWADWAATAQPACGTSFERVMLADGVLALQAGARTLEGQNLRAWICKHDPTWFGQAAANSAVMRMSEVDSIHRASAVTPSALTLPVALAHGRHHGQVTGDALMNAILVGQELAIRLALALGGASQLMHGVWPSYVVAPLAAAATVGRLRGLTHAACAGAGTGLSGTPAGTPAGPTTRPLDAVCPSHSRRRLVRLGS